jgi:hypothetical protein
MRRILLTKSPRPPRLAYVEAEAAPHSESAWAARLPQALGCVLGI